MPHMNDTDSTGIPATARQYSGLIGVAIAFVVPIGSGLILHLLRPHLSFAVGFALLLASEWLTTLMVLARVLVREHRPLRSIGLCRPTWREIARALVFWLLGLVAFALTLPVIAALGLSTGQARTLAALPLGLRLAIPLTAGFCEEVIFRGYAIERLTLLTGHRWGAAALSLVAFTAFHLAGFGLGGALQIGGWAVVVTLLYLWKRNLPACILMHILNDGYAYVLIPLMFH